MTAPDSPSPRADPEPLWRAQVAWKVASVRRMFDFVDSAEGVALY